MEIRRIEKNEPKYPKLRKTAAVAAAAVVLTAALGGCGPDIVGKEAVYDPSLEDCGDVAYAPGDDFVELSGETALYDASPSDCEPCSDCDLEVVGIQAAE